MTGYKILHLVSNPFFLNRGGLVRNLEQVRGTTANGHEILVCSYSGGEDVDGIKIKRIPWIFWYKNISGGVHDLHRLYMDFSLLIYGTYISFKFRPNIIHTHGLTGIVSARFYKLFHRKTIIVQDSEGTYADEMFPGKKHIILKQIVKLVEKIIYKFTNGIVVCSSELPAILKDIYHYTKPIAFVPEGMAPKVKGGDVARSTLNIKDDDIVIGFVGQFHIHQRMDIMMETFQTLDSKYAHVKFLIVGYPVDNLLEKYSLKNNPKFLFPGCVPYAQIQSYLSIMDIAVSTKTFESFPGNGKIMDYVAAEVPVVLFDHPVNRYYLGEDGVYAKLGDHIDFTNKLEQLIEDPSYRKIIKDKMILRNSKYDWKASINVLLAFYENLLTKKST